MNNTVNIDSKEVDQLLNNLADTDELNKILFDAVKEGAKTLQKKTKQIFRMKVGGVASSISRFTRKPFEDGITMKTDKGFTEATVSIMGEPKLKWFEKGTNDRYTKGYKITGYAQGKRNRLQREGKGHWTGKMTDKNFFRDARQGNDVNDAIIESINNALEKLNK